MSRFPAFPAPKDPLQCLPSVRYMWSSSRGEPMLREHLALRRDICAWDWHPCQNPVCFSSAGLFNQMACLFCLKRDKASTLPLVHMIHHRVSSASGDLSVHIRTCFLSFWPQRCLVFSSDGGSSSSSLPSSFVLLSVSSLADSLPNGAFHCSIASLTGDMKPLCSIWLIISCHSRLASIAKGMACWENGTGLLWKSFCLVAFWLIGYYHQLL